MADSGRERDLVLAPNEYAYVLDRTKGNVNVYVGPYKTSLANTDQLVVFNKKNKKFEDSLIEHAVRLFATAPEGWYQVMKNPARDGSHPKTGTVSNLVELDIGHKVNIPGPISFSLWPGQMVRVIKGHHLRSNQYLLVRVYDEKAARDDWENAVVKPQTQTSASEESSDSENKALALDIPDLTMGKTLIIKGTDISFYIPPTGIEVVRTVSNHYVRSAVTLERLEYCILLDENGNKRFIQGPAVVFPEPTETFVEKKGMRKFKAVELNENSGIYVKVIAPYSEGKKNYSVGDELFITGKDQMIYFPRPEHALIKYGKQTIHYAIAIPAGEGRYYLDRMSGKVLLKKGPAMFLPDPRKEVIVKRILNPKQVKQWFPGNQEALHYNQQLQRQLEAEKGAMDLLEEGPIAGETMAMAAEAPRTRKAKKTKSDLVGDDFTRQTGYTPPRTITLDTRYEGAVAISVWTGYAVLVVSRTAERKVVVGPHTYLLEYDEMLESTSLSTGTPKSDERLYKTVYLRVLHNKVSDQVRAETQDLCAMNISLSYRVNFEGEPKHWFNVENYVKFLCDHMRSLIRNIVKQYRVEEFYGNATNIIRDVILGTAGEDGQRPGRFFEENNMRIYDVEILDVSIGDEKIGQMLVQNQHHIVQQALDLSSEKRKLTFIQESEAIKREIAETQATTRQQALKLQSEEVKAQLMLAISQLNSKIEARRAELKARLEDQSSLNEINSSELERKKQGQLMELDMEKERLEQRLTELQADVESVVNKAKAVSPDLIAALQAFGDRALAEKMAESMAPLSILGGESIVDVFSKLVKGTKLEQLLIDKPGEE